MLTIKIIDRKGKKVTLQIDWRLIQEAHDPISFVQLELHPYLEQLFPEAR